MQKKSPEKKAEFYLDKEVLVQLILTLFFLLLLFYLFFTQARP